MYFMSCFSLSCGAVLLVSGNCASRGTVSVWRNWVLFTWVEGLLQSPCLRSHCFKKYSTTNQDTLASTSPPKGDFRRCHGQSINPRLALPANLYHPTDSHAGTSVRPRRKISQASRKHTMYFRDNWLSSPPTPRKIFWRNVFL